MPPDPTEPIFAIENVLASEEDAIAAYKIAVLRARAISDIRRCGEFLRMHEHAARDLSRVRARLLAKEGTWGAPWAPRTRLPAGTAQRIGALNDEEGMFEVLSSAEGAHAKKLAALVADPENRLPRDVQALLERIAAEAGHRRTWLNERASGTCAPAAIGTRIAARA